MPTSQFDVAATDPATWQEGYSGEKPSLILTEDIIHHADKLVEWTAEEERKLKRRIDLHVVPFLVITYMLTYYDKTVQSQAAIFTFLKDTHLVGNQYRNVSLIFYAGYIVGSYPCSYAAQRYNVAYSCAVMCLFWGLTVMLTVLCKDYKDLMIQRTFLGFVEAAIAPTFIALCGSWYKVDEQVLRIAFFYASTPLTQLWGPPLNYALGHMVGSVFGHETWKAMFIFAGAITMAWAFITFFFFPTDPTRAKWLSERERDIAIARLKVNNAGIVNHQFKWYQVVETFKDFNFWAICVIGFAITMTNGTTSSFASIVIKGFGFTNLQSLLLQMPWGYLAAQNMILGAWISGRYPGLRFYIYMAGCIPVIIGSALLWAAPDHKGPKLLGYYLLTTFGMAYAQVMSMCVSNAAGYTKKVTMAAGLFISYSIANIAAILAFQAKQAPKYQGGFTAVVVSVAIGFVTAFVLRMGLKRRNAQRDAEGSVDFDHALEDLTDLENPNFRYVL